MLEVVNMGDSFNIVVLIPTFGDFTVNSTELNLSNKVFLQVKIFENLAGVDRQFTTQLDQKLLSAAADNDVGVSTNTPENASTIALDSPNLPTDDQNPTLKRNTLEKLVGASLHGESKDQSVMIVEEVEYPSKDFEKQMLIERVRNSERGLTSSSRSVQSVAKLAKPSKPTHASADRSRVLDVVNKVDSLDLQRDALQSSSALNEVEEKKNTQQLIYKERDSVDLVVHEELVNVRRQIAVGDLATARRSLRKVKLAATFRFPFNRFCCFHPVLSGSVVVNFSSC
jgi:hypothetical protein